MGAQSFFGSPSAPLPTRINNAAALGDTTLVAAAAGKATRVYSLDISVAGATIVTLRRGATVLQVFNFAGVGGIVVKDLRELPYYVTGVNEALILNSSVAVQVDGMFESATNP